MPYTPMYYAASPGCMALSHGAHGACASGTCSGSVSAGACGAGHCAGGMTGGESEFVILCPTRPVADFNLRLRRRSDTRRLRWGWLRRRRRSRMWWWWRRHLVWFSETSCLTSIVWWAGAMLLTLFPILITLAHNEHFNPVTSLG